MKIVRYKHIFIHYLIVKNTKLALVENVLIVILVIKPHKQQLNVVLIMAVFAKTLMIVVFVCHLIVL